MKTRSLRRRALFLALLLAVALGGSPGCVYRLPTRSFDFDANIEGLGGCPDLAGTYKVAGHQTPYFIAVLVLPILPVWWERNPAPPRLDKDLGLVLRSGVPVAIGGAHYVRLAQPNADQLAITVLDESGRAIEGWDEIVIAHRLGPVWRASDPGGYSFRCWRSRSGEAHLSIEWTFDRGTPRPILGLRHIGLHPDGSGSLLLHAWDTYAFRYSSGWHWYEKVPPDTPSP